MLTLINILVGLGLFNCLLQGLLSNCSSVTVTQGPKMG